VETGEADMNTQPETKTEAESWIGIEGRQADVQRSGGGILPLMLFPLIAFSALAFAAFELAK
jgi:hypothetical protein